jgi:hypothetical protein
MCELLMQVQFQHTFNRTLLSCNITLNSSYYPQRFAGSKWANKCENCSFALREAFEKLRVEMLRVHNPTNEFLMAGDDNNHLDATQKRTGCTGITDKCTHFSALTVRLHEM